MPVVVQSLHLYPIKACRGLDVDRFTIGDTGPIGDRRWQIVDENGRPVTQRTAPALATISVDLHDDGGLELAADDHGSVTVADPNDGGDEVEVRVLTGGRVTAGDGGDEVATWLSDLIGQSARLVAMVDPTDIRLPEPIDLFGHAISFVDACPILVANQASCDWLVERAAEPFGMERFRANVVVSGAEPWAEDTWQDFTIGSAALTGRLPWPRCAVPQVDQRTGERHREPALTLRAHRWCTDAPTLPDAVRSMVEGNGLFGLACSVGPVGTEIAVGDELSVASVVEPVLAAPAG